MGKIYFLKIFKKKVQSKEDSVKRNIFIIIKEKIAIFHNKWAILFNKSPIKKLYNKIYDYFNEKSRYNTILEKPIKNKKEDLFGVLTYVKQLEYAIKKGATFIAINGKHGSGKSSIVNVLNQYRKDFFKHKFVNVNFLNINEKKIMNGESDLKTIDNYHRYFVNQVANDIYRNPYEIEKLFFNNFISYTTTKKIRNPFLSKMVDLLLTIDISIISLLILYLSFFKDAKIQLLDDIYGYLLPFLPFVFLIFIVLALIYGYGIYKPEKQDKSPMLDIDKCRNNFCKVLYDKLSYGTKLYLIIDDMDRLEPELQIKILSLLYNEYYPLNKTIKDIKIIFIFMIDINKLLPTLKACQLESGKLFDYILDVANNQDNVLKHYLMNLIDNNTNLKRIFSLTSQKEFLISIIVNNYTSIRDLKHCLNRIITKENYLYKKSININYSQLIFCSIIQGLYDLDEINLAFEKIVYNNNFEMPSKPASDSENDKKFYLLLSMIKNSYDKNIVDSNYYAYYYNFINNDNLLNNYEQKIFNISKYESWIIDDNDIKNISELLSNEQIRFQMVYDEIFKYATDENKILFLENKEFCDYITKLDDIKNIINIENLYENIFIGNAFKNITSLLYDYEKDYLIHSLLELNEQRLKEENEQLLTEYLKKLETFISHLKENVFDYNLKKLFENITLNDKLYSLLFNEVLKDKIPIGYMMFNDGQLSYEKISNKINNEFILKIEKIDSDFSIKLKEKLINNAIPYETLIYIVTNKDEKISNIDKLYENINNTNNYINYQNIEKIINIYGYNEKLDKHINKIIESNEVKKIVSFLNNNKLNISLNVVNKLSEIESRFAFIKTYEKIFIKFKKFGLYIYSRTINNNLLDIEDKYKNKQDYLEALKAVYKNCKNLNKDIIFSDIFIDYILQNFDFNTITFTENNFWKIKYLSNKILEETISSRIFDKLKSDNVLEKFCTYCSKGKTDIKNVQFLNLLKKYSIDNSISPYTIGGLTKRINNIGRRNQ